MPVLAIKEFATYAELYKGRVGGDRLDPESRFGREIRHHAFFRFNDQVNSGHSLITDDMCQIYRGLVPRLAWLAKEFGWEVVVEHGGPDRPPSSGRHPIFGGYKENARLDI